MWLLLETGDFDRISVIHDRTRLAKPMQNMRPAFRAAQTGRNIKGVNRRWRHGNDLKLIVFAALAVRCRWGGPGCGEPFAIEHREPRLRARRNGLRARMDVLQMNSQKLKNFFVRLPEARRANSLTIYIRVACPTARAPDPTRPATGRPTNIRPAVGDIERSVHIVPPAQAF